MNTVEFNASEALGRLLLLSDIQEVQQNLQQLVNTGDIWGYSISTGNKIPAFRICVSGAAEHDVKFYIPYAEEDPFAIESDVSFDDMSESSFADESDVSFDDMSESSFADESDVSFDDMGEDPFMSELNNNHSYPLHRFTDDWDYDWDNLDDMDWGGGETSNNDENDLLIESLLTRISAIKAELNEVIEAAGNKDMDTALKMYRHIKHELAAQRHMIMPPLATSIEFGE